MSIDIVFIVYFALQSSSDFLPTLTSAEVIHRPYTWVIINQLTCPICFSTHIGCSPADSVIEA